MIPDRKNKFLEAQMDSDPCTRDARAHGRFRLMGVQVDTLTISDLNKIVRNEINKARSTVIAHHNAHSIYLYHRNEEMRALYEEAEYAHIDGISLVLAGKLSGLPVRPKHRVTYVDWIDPLLAEANDSGWRIFYLGGQPGVIREGVTSVRSRYPDLAMSGHHGYFDANPESEENQKVLEQISSFTPDILMVGMGMPRQEKWIAENIDSINAKVILPSGACLDYVAGAVPTPPRWMGPVGLEWLYRFFQEPRRLWFRHFVEPLMLLPHLLKDVIKRRLNF